MNSASKEDYWGKPPYFREWQLYSIKGERALVTGNLKNKHIRVENHITWLSDSDSELTKV